MWVKLCSRSMCWQSVHPGCCFLCWPSVSPGFSFWNLDGETTFMCPCQVLLDGFQRGLLGPKIQSGLIKPVLTYTASPIFLESICHLDGWIKIRFKTQPEKNDFPCTNTESPLPVRLLLLLLDSFLHGQSFPRASQVYSPTSHSSMYVGGSKPPRWPGPK